MLACSLVRRLRPVSRTCNRHFHASPKRRRGDTVGDFLAQNQILHDVFQQIHDVTSLPWIISIPIATAFMRFLVTLPRVYLAFNRRNRNLATQSLQLEAAVIKEQGNIKLLAGIEDLDQHKEWQKRTWLKRRSEVEKRYWSLRPALFPSPSNTKFDVTNILNWVLVLVNARTLFYLSKLDPTMFDLEGIEDFRLLFVGVLFVPLAITNTCYYRNFSYSQFRSFVVMDWVRRGHWKLSKEQRRMATTAFLPPMIAGGLIIEDPGAVVLFALSNSIYTLLERLTIDKFIGAQTPVKKFGIRATSQETMPQSLNVWR